MIGRYSRLAPLFLLALILIILGMSVPLKQGLNIGGDDKFELCNAQLLERHPEMAAQLENDQPWLHTIIIAKAFALFGENAAIPRVLNLILTFFLVLAAWRLMGEGASPLAKILFLCFYFTSTEIPTLSASAMLEPPAIALAIIAVACSYARNGRLPGWRAYLAGGIMAMAVFTKLTALIVSFGWIVLIWQQRKATPLISMVARLASGFFVVSFVLISISPTFSFESLWLSHWKAQEIISAGHDPGHAFEFKDVFNEWIIFIPLVLGIIYQSRKPDYARRGTWFALAWLIADFAVHIWHKPWWSYYSIHFHVPVSIIAAQGAGWVIDHAWRAISSRSAGGISIRIPRFKCFWTLSENLSASLTGLLGTLLISAWYGIRLPNCLKECETISTTKTVQDDHFIPYIRKYGKQAKWIYSNDDNIPFFAGVLQPPELLLMTYKRTITGSLTKDKILQIVNAYQPELLLLRVDGELGDKRFQEMIAKGKYVKVMWDRGSELWVSPKCQPAAAKVPVDLIRSLGL